MLIVDPNHWLEEDGSLPASNPRLRRQALRVARLIEYGGPLKTGQFRNTLIECQGRPQRVPCRGFMAVAKLPEGILGFCPSCKTEQVLIHHWENTRWARGPEAPGTMQPR